MRRHWDQKQVLEAVSGRRPVWQPHLGQKQRNGRKCIVVCRFPDGGHQHVWWRKERVIWVEVVKGSLQSRLEPFQRWRWSGYLILEACWAKEGMGLNAFPFLFTWALATITYCIFSIYFSDAAQVPSPSQCWPPHPSAGLSIIPTTVTITIIITVTTTIIIIITAVLELASRLFYGSLASLLLPRCSLEMPISELKAVSGIWLISLWRWAFFFWLNRCIMCWLLLWQSLYFSLTPFRNSCFFYIVHGDSLNVPRCGVTSPRD